MYSQLKPARGLYPSSLGMKDRLSDSFYNFLDFYVLPPPTSTSELDVSSQNKRSDRLEAYLLRGNTMAHVNLHCRLDDGVGVFTVLSKSSSTNTEHH